MNSPEATFLKTFCLAALLVLTYGVRAQNLVADPGLEDTLKCPLSIGRFYHPTNTTQQYIAQWRATTLASPDLHNLCGYNGFAPRNGDGYAGIIVYDPTEYREYITALLSSPLEAGTCYYVEFYVALAPGSVMAIDEFQVHFSIGVPLDLSFPPPGPLALTPHLQAATAPTLNTYQKVAGFYMATGGENAMTLGNFSDNANTTLTQVSTSGQINSYYYIDDVSVSRLDLGADKAICDGDVAEIVPNIQCPDASYNWSTGSTAQSIQVGTAGPVWVQISGNGSCTVADTVNIIVQAPPNAGIGGTDTICTNEAPVDLGDLLNGNPDPNGLWVDPNGSNFNGMVDPATAASGSYTYNVSGNGVCPDTMSTLTIVFEPCLGIGQLQPPVPIVWLGQDAAGVHHFQIEGRQAAQSTVELLNSKGQLVQAATQISEHSITLELGSSASGTYVLLLLLGNVPTSLKFVHSGR